MLVGYGPKTAAAKRRPRKDDAAAAPAPCCTRSGAGADPGTRRGSGRGRTGARHRPAPASRWPSRRSASWPGTSASTCRRSSGTGPQGSITRDDVQAATSTAVPAQAIGVAAAATAPAFGPDREQRIPIKGVRKLTAENMVASAFTAPHVTEFLTVDVTRTMKALDRLKAMPEWRDVRVSPLLLVAKAVLLAIAPAPDGQLDLVGVDRTRSSSRSTSTSASRPPPSAA